MTDQPTPERDLLLDIEAGISHLFRSGRRASRAYSDEVHPDLQPTGFSILRMIVQSAPVQAGTIIAATGLDKSAVSRQIKVLRDLGLIHTQPDPDDGRSCFIVPTTFAEERMESVRRLVRRDYRERFDGWPREDLKAFSELLERFNARDSGD